MNKAKNFILITLFFAACLGITLLFLIFTSDTDFSGEMLSSDRIRFTQDGGETVDLALSDCGIPRLDGVYTATFTLKGGENNFNVSLHFGAGDIRLWLDEDLIYTGTTASGDSLSSSPAIEITLGNSDAEYRLTAEIRYSSLDNYIFPVLVRMDSDWLREQRLSAVANSYAIPAGMAAVAFLLVLGLFFMSISFLKPDFSLLFLSLGIGWCFLRLLFHTQAVSLAGFAGRFLDFLDAFPYIPALLALVYILLNRKKSMFKYFITITASLAVAIIAVHILTLLAKTVPAIMNRSGNLVNLISSNSFLLSVNLATYYLILICAAAALIYYIKFISNIIFEKSMLEAQSGVISSGYANIVNTMERTASIRHEWKNDLLTLGMFYEQNRLDDLGEYLKKKNSQLSELDRIHFTENFVFDVILSSFSARAQEEGVRFEVSLNIPKSINIKDEDLCSLLMNMLNNAFNACHMIEESQRYISFRAAQNGNFLAICCSNSAPFSTPKAPESGSLSHGWGLKIMQKICQRYGSDLQITNVRGDFTVMTALQIPAAQGESSASG